ncbi:hypothetical protein FRC02_004209 [Tulasnella sp. 418]|nr:hypothetical protein FRC02_004209 [Tulasnella sp. 418]
MSDGRSTLKEQSDRLSFKVRRPSPLSRQSSNGPDSEAGTPSFRIPPPPNKSLNLPPTYKGDSSKRRFAGQTFHHNNSDSDEEDETADELITGFDELGVQRYR